MLEAIGEHKISLNWEENNFGCYIIGDGDCDDGDGGDGDGGDGDCGDDNDDFDEDGDDDCVNCDLWLCPGITASLATMIFVKVFVTSSSS